MTRDISVRSVAIQWALVVFAATGCASRSEDSEVANTPGPPRSGPALVVRQSRAVVYKFLKSSADKKQSNISLANGNLNITIRPEDFRGAPIECGPEECVATLVEPIVVNATVPTGWNAKVKVRYRKAKQSNETKFSHYVTVGGQWTLFQVGDFVNLSVEAGITLVSQAENRYLPRISEITCSKSLTCETPLFVLSGSLDRNGLVFDSRLVVSQQNGDWEKVVSDYARTRQEISFDKFNVRPLWDLINKPACCRNEVYDTQWGIEGGSHGKPNPPKEDRRAVE